MTKNYFKCRLKLLMLFCFSLSFSQTYIPGNVYYDSTGYVEYRAGNLPIIISAPHGGSLKPAEIPDRDCEGCRYLQDTNTQQISEGMYNEIYETSGLYPHLLINQLHRSKFDANRSITIAADGNATVEESWHAYHDFIDSAKAKITSEYGRGLFFDIHGHAHSIQRIELGYLLSQSELERPDSELNTNASIEESSLRTLTSDNEQDYSHAELLRGENSFGTLLTNHGFPTVPSSAAPFPLDSEPYFNGGYNTERHGSQENNGEIDAIQVELNQDVRFNTENRLNVINSLSQSALHFYNVHHNGQFTNNYNTLVLGTYKNNINPSISLYPNPASNYVVITSGTNDLDVILYNTIGQKIITKKINSSEKIDVRNLKNGIYLVKIYNKEMLLKTHKLIIK